MGEWTSLSVKAETKEYVEQYKQNGVSWDAWLRDVVDEGVEEPHAEPTGTAIDSDVLERLTEFKNLLESTNASAQTAEERTGQIQRQLEEMGR